MKRRVGVGGIALAVMATGVARAVTDIAIAEEEARRNVVTPMGTISFPTLGPKPERPADGVYKTELKIDTVISREQAERRAQAHHALGAPYDESHQLKNPQADIYTSAADLLSPLPDRLSVVVDSPFYEDYGKIGVRFDGKDRPGDVEEYCVSEGWIRIRTFMANGKPKKERGKFVCLKRYGKVEPYRK